MDELDLDDVRSMIDDAVESLVTQQDLDLHGSQIDAAIRSTQKLIADETELINARLEAMEKQVATMLMGYVEQAAIVDALTAIIPDELQPVFLERIKETRQQMMEVLGTTADVLENGDPTAG